MKLKCPNALLPAVLAFAVVSNSATAASAAGNAGVVSEFTGAITGRVRNPVTGQYLNNARIAVRGTDLVVFTDETGTYRLARVPAGPVVLETFFTGMDSQQVSLQVTPGATVTQDFDLNSVARYGQAGGVVTLDPFIAVGTRETNAQAIAINEQRFAPNLKLVVSTDSSDVLDSNVGEFLKFLPGLTAEYDRSDDASTVSGMNLRGFASNLVSIATDGAQMANISGASGMSRSFFFNQVSINNVARVEITKVPTPADAADSLAGSVNLISKSAFERKEKQLRYSVNLTGSSMAPLTLGRTPHTLDREIHKILPGANFDFTWPVSRNFGVVLTGMMSNRFSNLQESRNVYNTAGTGTGASVERPFLQTYTALDSPRTLERSSLGVKADWRATPNSVLSVGAQGSKYKLRRIATGSWALNVGNNGTPTPANGTSMSFGDNFVIGATGRGVLQTAHIASISRLIDTVAGNVNYRFDDGTWRVLGAINVSKSDGGVYDSDQGHFRQFDIRLRVPVRISFLDNNAIRPGQIHVYDNSNSEIDIYDPASYIMNTALSNPRLHVDAIRTGRLDVRRSLGFLPFPAALQVGALQKVQVRDTRRESLTYTYNGVNGDRSPAPFLSPVYVNQENAFGFRNIPPFSVIQGWRAFETNPGLFTQTPAQVVATEVYRKSNSEYLRERVQAFYGQAEVRLLKGRLHVLGGLRHEKTTGRGEGLLSDPSAVFARNADGSFARDAGGNRIRRPEAGAAGSVQETQLTLTERGSRASRSYDDFFPSLHVNYNFSENLVGRAAYARTYGRPDIDEIIPNVTINDDLRRLSSRNPALQPWDAHNYDLSLEYYTKTGGILSAGVFRKNVSNFFGSASRFASAEDVAALGLDQSYEGWEIVSQFNAPGGARIDGVELNLNQSLAKLGGWARYFSVFANGTRLWFSGNQSATFSGSVPKSFNGGFSFSRKPISFAAKYNFRGRQRGSAVAALGPGGFNYEESRDTLDLNAEYQWSKRLSLFANAQNVFDEPIITLSRGPSTPAYAQRLLTSLTGVTIAVGIRGTY